MSAARWVRRGGQAWREVSSLGVRGLLAVGGLALATLAGAAYLLARPEAPASLRATLSLAEALGEGRPGDFVRALGPRPFAFPADHGPHPDYRTEWWYYTGNLETADGRHLGFQVTFFRAALAAVASTRGSAWATRDVFMAHLAVTDTVGGRVHAVDRLSRTALGLAGATAEPFRVWLEDWSVEGLGPAGLPMRLHAADGAVAVDLTLGSAKPPVLHGERGLSRKSAEPGAASYYYSLTRMPAQGTVRVGPRTLQVRGLAWMDREWSTSALGSDQVGWDWFALQLDDGRELMLYRLRRRDGSVDPVSQGTLIDVDGTARTLAPDAVRVDVLDHWSSPRDGSRYPARWRLAVPASELELEVTPYLADQELDLTVRYWEGAVRVQGVAAGRPTAGHGYVELTGYAPPRPLGRAQGP